jgi:YD repeat-containing protein
MTTFVYDENGRITNKGVSTGSISYLTSYTYPNGPADANTLVSGMEVTTGKSSSVSSSTLSYDANGLLASSVKDDGTNTITDRYGYDGSSRLTSCDSTYQSMGRSQASDSTLSFTRDDSGRITSVDSKYTTAGGAEEVFNMNTYRYDDQGRLAFSSDAGDDGLNDCFTYEYDGSGRLSKATEQYLDVSLSSSAGGSDYAYTYVYSYDDQSRVSSIKGTNDRGSTKTYSFSYEGQRVSKVESSQSPGANSYDSSLSSTITPLYGRYFVAKDSGIVDRVSYSTLPTKAYGDVVCCMFRGPDYAGYDATTGRCGIDVTTLM